MEIPGNDAYDQIEIYDRQIAVLKKIVDGEERVGLDVELLFPRDIYQKYMSVEFLSAQISERQEYISFYEDAIKSILDTEELEEFHRIQCQAYEHDYYEPLYAFCDSYIIKVTIPYELEKSELISYRDECRKIEFYTSQMKEEKQECIRLMKNYLKIV